jgi:uncharacterized membrane protein YsdA (DUF1294 family)
VNVAVSTVLNTAMGLAERVAAAPALLLLAWLTLWGAMTFLVFAWDKFCARRGWRRISEAMLLFLSLTGGILGAKLGQRWLRHKTYKQPFGHRLNQIQGLWLLALFLWGLNILFPGLAGAAMSEGMTFISDMEGLF